MAYFQALLRRRLCQISRSELSPRCLGLRPNFSPALVSTPPFKFSTHFQKAHFSSSSKQRDGASYALAAKLMSEHDFEVEALKEQTADLFVKDFNRLSFELTDVPTKSQVTLTKKYNDEDIKISFSVFDANNADVHMADLFDRDANNLAFEHGFKQGQASLDGDTAVEEAIHDIGSLSFPCNVHIEIRKPASDQVLSIDAIAEDGEFLIDSLSLSSSPIDGKSDRSYTGPAFSNLEESIQLLFHQYLEVRGINTDLALLIPKYIDWKDKKEYIRWLDGLQEFLQHESD